HRRESKLQIILSLAKSETVKKSKNTFHLSSRADEVSVVIPPFRHCEPLAAQQSKKWNPLCGYDK
ncbi:MAG: hypothetical protein LBP54_01020, partial [Campylobacteraceae bacterium]|nr:hypothetical protein [Campylobacteraceae bacterium]